MREKKTVMSELLERKVGRPFEELQDAKVATASSVNGKSRPRRVFGRREGVVGERTFRFEMRPDGVHLWRKHSKKRKHVSWMDLVHVAEGQGLLKL